MKTLVLMAIGAVAAAPGLERAHAALLAAEGSDWFWWFGSDQESRNDASFDELFRAHVRGAYRAMGMDPPADTDEAIVPHPVVWTFAYPVARIGRRDQLTIRTNCPGRLTLRVGVGDEQTKSLTAVGGVMAGARRFQVTLGVFDVGDVGLRFGDRRGDVREHTRLVHHHDAQHDAEIALDMTIPIDGDQAFGRLPVFGQVAARGLVDDDALARRQIADDVVAGYRMAAVAEADHAALASGDQDALAAAGTGRGIGTLAVARQSRGDVIGDAVAQRDVGQQLLQSLELQFGQIVFQAVDRQGFQ